MLAARTRLVTTRTTIVATTARFEVQIADLQKKPFGGNGPTASRSAGQSSQDMLRGHIRSGKPKNLQFTVAPPAPNSPSETDAEAFRIRAEKRGRKVRDARRRKIMKRLEKLAVKMTMSRAGRYDLPAGLLSAEDYEFLMDPVRNAATQRFLAGLAARERTAKIPEVPAVPAEVAAGARDANADLEILGQQQTYMDGRTQRGK